MPKSKSPRTHAARADRPSYAVRATGQPWCADLTLSNRRRIVLRPIDPADAEVMPGAFSTLSPEDVRMRFLHPINGLTPEMVHAFCNTDRDRELALVLTDPDPPGSAMILAVARAIVDAGTRRAEFAIVLGAPLRGYGLGEFLVRKLVDWARRKRLRELVGDVLQENHAMLRLTDKLGFRREASPGEIGVLRVVLPLRPPGRDARA